MEEKTQSRADGYIQKTKYCERSKLEWGGYADRKRNFII